MFNVLENFSLQRVLRGNALSGESRERVTLWSGVLGADAHEWRVQGESHSRQFSKAGLGPTTTKAQRVVIVGYNKGKALFVLPDTFSDYGLPRLLILSIRYSLMSCWINPLSTLNGPLNFSVQ